MIGLDEINTIVWEQRQRIKESGHDFNDFLMWAFDSEELISESRKKWNEKHSGVFVIGESDTFDSTFPKCVDAYLDRA